MISQVYHAFLRTCCWYWPEVMDRQVDRHCDRQVTHQHSWTIRCTAVLDRQVAHQHGWPTKWTALCTTKQTSLWTAKWPTSICGPPSGPPFVPPIGPPFGPPIGPPVRRPPIGPPALSGPPRWLIICSCVCFTVWQPSCFLQEVDSHWLTAVPCKRQLVRGLIRIATAVGGGPISRTVGGFMKFGKVQHIRLFEEMFLYSQ